MRLRESDQSIHSYMMAFHSHTTTTIRNYAVCVCLHSLRMTELHTHQQSAKSDASLRAMSHFFACDQMFGQLAALLWVRCALGCVCRHIYRSAHAKKNSAPTTSTYGKLFLHSQREVARRYMVFVVAKCCGALNFNLCVAPAFGSFYFIYKCPLSGALCKISSTDASESRIFSCFSFGAVKMLQVLCFFFVCAYLFVIVLYFSSWLAHEFCVVCGRTQLIDTHY